MSSLALKSVSELKEMSFYIPDYQRGYRWGKQQVVDLLDDIHEFNQKGNAGIYCLQPLVVIRKFSDNQLLLNKIKKANNLDEIKRLLNGQWEVVDGQQRLTTIRIILEILHHPRFYDIDYATRKGSAEFLNEVTRLENNEKSDINIDYHHIRQAAHTIDQWMKVKMNGRSDYSDHFLKVLLEQVKFIWYEIEDANPDKNQNDIPKEVFRRLNIGKIPLTNAELIKALLLNKSNFNSNDGNAIRLLQQEIASEWDTIEYTLQSSEFWLFLNQPGIGYTTRIDYIFNLICQNDLLGCTDKENSSSDAYKTFRYFNLYLTEKKSIPMNQAVSTIWTKVQEIFHTFLDWFNDMELYHYIGFLICMNFKVDAIYLKWNSSPTRSDFRNYLMDSIKSYLNHPDIENTVYEVATLDHQESAGGPKTNCRPILLLHNLQTVINQNKTLTSNKKYDGGVFYKFPFHLYKSEGWDVEHIDSNTENTLENEEERQEWLLNAYFGLQEQAFDNIRNDIQDFLKQDTENSNEPDEGNHRSEQFKKLKEDIEAIYRGKQLSQTDKNKIWNFTLLDSSTNRSYGNAIFPAKRRVIIGKDQGKKFRAPSIDSKNGLIQIKKPTNANSSFIPPCTKYVFLKYYNTTSFTPYMWTEDDARAYLDNILEVLKEFLS